MKSTPSLQALQQDLSQVIEVLIARAEWADAPLSPDELASLRARVSAARIGRPCTVEERTVWAIDRLGNVARGPVFTSTQHDWPCTPTGERMAPLCQVVVQDLPQPPEGLDGLLQVWMPPGELDGKRFLVRHIPAAEATADTLTPLPEWGEQDPCNFLGECPWLEDMASEPRPSQAQFMLDGAKRLGFKSVDALESEDDTAYWSLREAYGDQFTEPSACFQLLPKATLVPYCDLGDASTLLKDIKRFLQRAAKSGQTLPEDLKPLLEQLCSLSEALTKICAKSTYPCLGGTFSPIQYQPHEQGLPLLCLESLGDYDWGDGGNAQLFYDPKRGAYFDWSCF